MVVLGIFVADDFLSVAFWTGDGQPRLVPDVMDLAAYRHPLVIAGYEESVLVSVPAVAVVNETPGAFYCSVDWTFLDDDSPRAVGPGRLDMSIDVAVCAILARLRHNAMSVAGKSFDAVVIGIASPLDVTGLMRLKLAARAVGFDNVLVKNALAVCANFNAQGSRAGSLRAVVSLNQTNVGVLIAELGQYGANVIGEQRVAEISAEAFSKSVLEGVLRRTFRRDGSARHKGQIEAAKQRVLNELGSAPDSHAVRWAFMIEDAIVESVFGWADLVACARDVTDALVTCIRGMLDGSAHTLAELCEIVVLGEGFGAAVCARSLRTAIGTAWSGKIVEKASDYVGAYAAATLAGAMVLDRSARTVSADLLDSRLEYGLVVQGAGDLEVDVLFSQEDDKRLDRTTRVFRTARPEQRRVILELVVRSGPEAEWISGGVFGVGPLNRPRLNCPVEVSFVRDADGIIWIEASDVEFKDSIGVLDLHAPTSGNLASLKQRLQELGVGTA